MKQNLIILSVSTSSQCLMKMKVNNELERMWNEAVTACTM